MNDLRNIKIIFSNLIINKYVIRNDEINKFIDILQSYFDEHKKKFNRFRKDVIWKRNDVIINKISVPCTITYLQTHMFKPIMEEMPVCVKVPLNEVQNMIDRRCVYNLITDEINILFISKLKDITISHYVEQPRSMLCRKLERNSIELDDPALDPEDFDYHFFPECFRLINKSFDFFYIINDDEIN